MGDLNTSQPESITIKPGYKSSEFYLSLVAMIMGILLTSGIIPETGPWSQVVGIICTVLSAFGYSVSRSKAKTPVVK